MNTKTKAAEAFTLIELLVVIAITNPVQVFAFADDHEQSVDDGMMVVDDPLDDSTDMNFWWDLPADRHGQGCSFSFADGHVEHWHWRCPKKFKAHYQHA